MHRLISQNLNYDETSFFWNCFHFFFVSLFQEMIPLMWTLDAVSLPNIYVPHRPSLVYFSQKDF